ncbi:MAG: 50S ribosomal protein L18 [Candidatus Zambryskibacteria bacterium]|nr:50S ribosomal protein L18 [Candidatus Zambryskibacteria bacterium]
MKNIQSKTAKRIRRKLRIRAKISGTETKPRLAVFKSNQYISAQLIDDTKGVTLASAHSKTMKDKTLALRSFAVGKQIAALAKAKKVETVVFDRGGFIYTGNIKAVSEGAREGGLIF